MTTASESKFFITIKNREKFSNSFKDGEFKHI